MYPSVRTDSEDSAFHGLSWGAIHDLCLDPAGNETPNLGSAREVNSG